MTKRSVDSDIDDLNEELLSALTPEERLQLFLEAAAADRHDWARRLGETCERRRYLATDAAYTTRVELAFQFLQVTIYALHTAVLLHELIRQQQLFLWLFEVESDGDSSPPASEAVEDRADSQRMLFSKLYVNYYAAQQFATERLGIDIETWFAAHPRGESVLTMVEEVLDSDIEKDLADDALAEQTAAEDEAATLETQAEEAYETLVTEWEQALQQVPT
jgi:hypothetical protein